MRKLYGNYTLQPAAPIENNNNITALLVVANCNQSLYSKAID
jgi:hypothetical protein